MAPHRGFTLIEILVAMMVLSICITVILQLFSGGLRSSRLSDDYTRAVFLAAEKMEELLLRDRLGEKSVEGDFEGGYRWAARIRPVTDDAAEAAIRERRGLFDISVDVLWKEEEREKRFRLQTLKYAWKLQEES